MRSQGGLYASSHKSFAVEWKLRARGNGFQMHQVSLRVHAASTLVEAVSSRAQPPSHCEPLVKWGICLQLCTFCKAKPMFCRSISYLRMIPIHPLKNKHVAKQKHRTAITISNTQLARLTLSVKRQPKRPVHRWSSVKARVNFFCYASMFLRASYEKHCNYRANQVS